GVEERTAVGYCALGIEPPAAIGKAVGCHIKDAHHQRAVSGKACPRRPRRRQQRELLPCAWREARTGTRQPALKLGNRGGNRNEATVWVQSTARHQGEREAGTSEWPGQTGR